VGAALIAPVRALRAADVSEGKTGADLALLIAMAFVATHTPELVSAGWIGYAEGLGVGFATLLGVLSSAVAAPVTFLLIATIVLTVAAGSRRSLGRDFDLACVSLVPFVVVELVAGLAFAALGAQPHGLAADAVTALAYGWALLLLVLAWRQARSRSPAASSDAADAAEGGR